MFGRSRGREEGKERLRGDGWGVRVRKRMVVAQ